jgi:hypothetical protein
VAVALNVREPEATKLYREYWKLKRLHRLYSTYTELGDKGLGAFLKLYRLMKEKGVSIEQVVNAVYDAIHKLPYIENLYEQVKEQIHNMQRTRQGLANDIEERKKKISLLDNIIFSSKQDCKRAEQQVQELTAQKNRIEMLIANILNREGYSKLRQIVKENVKAILSQNKIFLSVSFAAITQTLKDDPGMVKLICHTSTGNNGEQHKDNNNNNITNYLEANKHRLLDFAEKNYENLVEELTNSAIDTAAASNPRLLLPQSSSSTFSSLSNQSDTHRIEK